jgi:pimeloyl-ACP methyl ester carboxylesterase
MRRLLSHALATGLVFALGVGSGCNPVAGTAFADIDYGLQTKTVRVGTADIAYVEMGSGKRTLVLIHGLASYLPAWKNNLAALSRDYRVIAIDLPGFGKSSKANYAYSMEFYAKVVRGVIRELDLARPTLVGHSMGGQIAMTYALMYPDRLEALVLTSPAGLEAYDDGEAQWLAQAVTPEFTCAADDESIYVRHTQNFHRMPKDAAFMVDDRIAVRGGPDFDSYCTAVSRSVAGMLDAPVVDRLGQIAVPTLVLFGEYDRLIPNPLLHGGSTVALAQRAVKRIPGARLEILDKAGHMAQFERAAQWNERVLDFLARTDAPPAGAGSRAPVPAPSDGPTPLYEPGTDPDDAPPDAPDPPAATEPPVEVDEPPAPPPAPAAADALDADDALPPEPAPP